MQGALVPVQPNTKYEYWPSSGWIPQAVMRTALHSGSPELMTAEQIKEMTVSDHQCLWQVCDSVTCAFVTLHACGVCNSFLLHVPDSVSCKA